MKAIYRIMAFGAVLVMIGCTQESQNKIGRSIQNWTGTDGVLEIYAGDKLVRRFPNIDNLSTALSFWLWLPGCQLEHDQGPGRA